MANPLAKPLAQLAKADPVKLALGAGIVLGVVYLLGRQLAKDAAGAVGAAADAISRVNEGTPYEGTGIVGTIGNATNQASGGVLAEIGGWIGRTIYDLTHPEYKP